MNYNNIKASYHKHIIMFQYLILFGFSLTSIYFTINNFKKQEYQQSFTDKWKIAQSLLSCGIFASFIEESVFRSTIKTALIGYPYAEYINSVLFGMTHLSNYYFNPNLLQIGVQFFMTTYMGYLCVLQDSFLYAYLIHMCYNMFIMGTSYLIFNLFIYEKKEETKCNFQLFDIFPSFNINKLSVDDMQLKSNKSIRIKKTNLKPDMIERWKLLDDIEHKRIYKNKEMVLI